MDTKSGAKRRVRKFRITAVLLVLVMVAALCASAPAKEAQAAGGYTLVRKGKIAAGSKCKYVLKGLKEGQFFTVKAAREVEVTCGKKVVKPFGKTEGTVRVKGDGTSKTINVVCAYADRTYKTGLAVTIKWKNKKAKTLNSGEKAKITNKSIFADDLKDAEYELGAEEVNALEMTLNNVPKSMKKNGTVAYQWYVADGESGKVPGLEIEGAEESSFTPDVSEAGVKEYFCIASYTANDASKPSWYAITNTATITVKEPDIDVPEPEVPSSSEIVVPEPIVMPIINPVVRPAEITMTLTGEDAWYQAGDADPAPVVCTASVAGHPVSVEWFSTLGEIEQTNPVDGGMVTVEGNASVLKPDTSETGVKYYFAVARVGNREKVSRRVKVEIVSALEAAKRTAEAAIADAISAFNTLNASKTKTNWDAWRAAYGENDPEGVDAAIRAYETAGGNSSDLTGLSSYLECVYNAHDIGWHYIYKFRDMELRPDQYSGITEPPETVKEAIGWHDEIVGETFDGTVFVIFDRDERPWDICGSFEGFVYGDWVLEDSGSYAATITVDADTLDITDNHNSFPVIVYITSDCDLTFTLRFFPAPQEG
ncbi:MAG: hypothetical protein J6Z46_06700 [Lachnospiraceae bacterium]|nr:hypothetical protein [Lachnospiraceae bacterium]